LDGFVGWQTMTEGDFFDQMVDIHDKF
jgi:hypothetical protein